MKNTFVALLLMAAVTVTAQTDTVISDPVILETSEDSLSYFLGLSLGYDLQTLPFKADPELILVGFTEVTRGTNSHDLEATKVIFAQLQQSIMAKQAAKASQLADENLNKGQEFLAENGKREGVITTASGLQYEVIVQGDGPMPSATSEVKVNYEGTLLDGSVFDSSYKRGEPISFTLDKVIPGWTEGLQLMPVGSTYMFYIASNLGYGGRAMGSIPANSTLTFKVELLEIK